MTVFKAFWKVVKSYKVMIIMYTVILIGISMMNMVTGDNNLNFVDSKANIAIVNRDSDNAITNNLIKYITDNNNIKEIDENKLDDAVFYRDVNYIIYIPENYGQDVLNNMNPEIDIKSSGDYLSSLANMMLERYINIQNIYNEYTDDETELVNYINNNLEKKSEVEVTSKIDIYDVANASSFFNFASYSVMAVVIFIICLVMTTFKEQTIYKRTIIGSMDYRKHNRYILYGSLVYVLIVWIIYTLLARIMIGDFVFTTRGLIYVLNLLVFSFCSLTIALLISTLVNNKNAVNGIVNVVALGSAFLCGAFIPVEMLSEGVLKIAHLLPSYYYINSNNLLGTIEEINVANLNDVFINTIILLGYSILFIIINNIVSKKKLKIN